MMIPAAQIRDDNLAIVLDFHALIFDAQSPHQLHAADLKPHQVICVIDDAHLVGFRVAHTNSHVVVFDHPHFRSYSGSPCQTGLRFSRNEATPSLKSGVHRIRAFSRIARSRSASRLAASAETSRRFARVRLLGLASIKTCASSRARSSSRSAGTTSVIRPYSFASSAPIIRPVSNRSRERFCPICRVRNTDTIAGRNPIFTSVYPNLASGVASVKSQSVAIPQPPAKAAPFTAAMSGFEKLQMRRNIFAIRRESSWFSEGDCCAIAASISRSMPAQNALPLPVRIPTRAWLFSISSSADCSSDIIAAEIAFRLSGRLSVRVARFPLMSRRSVENILETPPQFTSGACAYFARISLVISSTFVNRDASIPGSAPALRSVARTSSVATLPTRLSPANGQPPSPVNALSNLRHPASYAARIFSSAFSGRLCRCTPNSTPATWSFTSRNKAATISGVAFPAVSASETVRTRISFSHSSVSCTTSAPQGSSYGLPNAIEM